MLVLLHLFVSCRCCGRIRVIVKGVIPDHLVILVEFVAHQPMLLCLIVTKAVGTPVVALLLAGHDTFMTRLFTITSLGLSQDNALPAFFSRFGQALGLKFRIGDSLALYSTTFIVIDAGKVALYASKTWPSSVTIVPLGLAEVALRHILPPLRLAGLTFVNALLAGLSAAASSSVAHAGATFVLDFDVTFRLV